MSFIIIADSLFLYKGETYTKSGDLLASIYAGLDAPLIRTDIEVAEMVKYTDDVWHALKVGFANEIENICKSLEVDSHQAKVFLARLAA